MNHDNEYKALSSGKDNNSQTTFGNNSNQTKSKLKRFLNFINSYATIIMAFLTLVTLTWSIITTQNSQKQRNIELEVSRTKAEIDEIKQVGFDLMDYELENIINNIMIAFPNNENCSEMRKEVSQQFAQFKSNYRLFLQTITPYGIPTVIESQTEEPYWYALDSASTDLNIDNIYDTICIYSGYLQNMLFFFEYASNYEGEEQTKFIKNNAEGMVGFPPVYISGSFNGKPINKYVTFAEYCNVFDNDYYFIKQLIAGYLLPIASKVEYFTWNLGFYVEMVLDAKVENMMHRYHELGLATDDSLFYSEYIKNY